MVERGELLLGVPCAPTTITHYIAKDGHLETEEVSVWKKISLKGSGGEIAKETQTIHAIEYRCGD